MAVYYFREVDGRSTTPTKPTLSENVSVTGGKLSGRKSTSFFEIFNPSLHVTFTFESRRILRVDFRKNSRNDSRSCLIILAY